MSKDHTIADSVKDILQAIKETAKGNYVPDEVKEQRLGICKKCTNFIPSTVQCSVCLCFLDWKASLKVSVCPDEPPQWSAYNGKK